MKFYCLFSIFLLQFACGSPTKERGETAFGRADFGGFNQVAKNAFEKRNVIGCFILHDVNNETRYVYNPERAAKPFLPASTYKILNSLIALECEVINDEKELFAWDSVSRSVPAWNRDHTMESGIRYSVVWFYQELARRIGRERMQYWVREAGYGNEEIGKAVDSFWLRGDLRITPLQQVDFLEDFANGDLPFNANHIQTVKRLLIEDSGAAYTLRGKTGWATHGIPVGWYVGYLELDGSAFIFVNNLEIRDNEDARARKQITKEILDAVFKIQLDL